MCFSEVIPTDSGRLPVNFWEPELLSDPEIDTMPKRFNEEI